MFAAFAGKKMTCYAAATGRLAAAVRPRTARALRRLRITSFTDAYRH